MKYTIQELKHLRDIRSIGFDDSFADDEHGTERGFFKHKTDNFFDWLEKMEKRNRIKHLLAPINCDCTHTQACKVCGEKKGLDGDFWKNLKA